jgi:hypothetical protein
MLHSVPRPALEYVVTDDDDDGSNEEEDGNIDDDDDEEYHVVDLDEEEDDDLEEVEDFQPLERFVVLFNTWDEKPLGSDEAGGASNEEDWFTVVPSSEVDDESSAQPGGIGTLDQSDGGGGLSSPVAPVPCQALRCRPKREWKTVAAHTGSGGGGDEAKKESENNHGSGVVLSAPMLGDRFRRGRKANALVLLAEQDPQKAEAAFLGASDPAHIPVRDIEG